MKNQEKDTLFWGKYDRCDECGAEKYEYCADLNNREQRKPCNGRPLAKTLKINCLKCKTDFLHSATQPMRKFCNKKNCKSERLKSRWQKCSSCGLELKCIKIDDQYYCIDDKCKLASIEHVKKIKRIRIQQTRKGRKNMNQYLELLKTVRVKGEMRTSRGHLSDGSNPRTQSIFGTQTRYDLSDYKLPLITTKKIGSKGIITELLWFLRGESNIAFLKKHDCNIWNNWANEEGELGPVYGVNWRNWEGVDQIKEIEQTLKTNPSSRRIILSAWNVPQLKNMALPPCHVMAQFYVDGQSRLSCQLYQRSADLFLGVPWNIASYSILTMMLARCHGFEPHELIHTIGDAHIYENHFNQVDEQIKRIPFEYPNIFIEKKESILDYTHKDFVIANYNHYSKLDGEVAV